MPGWVRVENKDLLHVLDRHPKIKQQVKGKAHKFRWVPRAVKDLYDMWVRNMVDQNGAAAISLEDFMVMSTVDDDQ